MLRKWTQSDSGIEIITKHQVPNKLQSYNFKNATQKLWTSKDYIIGDVLSKANWS
jgi:hypothetical protein